MHDPDMIVISQKSLARGIAVIFVAHFLLAICFAYAILTHVNDQLTEFKQGRADYEYRMNKMYLENARAITKYKDITVEWSNFLDEIKEGRKLIHEEKKEKKK